MLKITIYEFVLSNKIIANARCAHEALFKNKIYYFVKKRNKKKRIKRKEILEEKS